MTALNLAITVTGSSAPITIGDPNIEAINDNGNGNLLIVQKTTLGVTATIQSLSFYVRVVGGGLRLGIYDASGAGGNPGNLLASTPAFTPVVGWNTVNVSTQVQLAAGTYWLAYLPQSSTLGFQLGTGSAIWSTFTYNAMPAAFPAAGLSTGPYQWSFYATLLTQTQPDTIPPSVPTNLAATPTSQTQVMLSWTASTDNVGVTGYNIYRGGVQIGTAPSNSFTDNDPTLNTVTTQYSYTVAAFDAAGNVSAQSTPAVSALFNPSADPWATLDGRVGATPGGVLPFTSVLNGYGTTANNLAVGRYRWPTSHTWPSTGNLIQPPWMVPGVDYPVGINRTLYPTNTNLKDPSNTAVLGGSVTSTVFVNGSPVIPLSSVPSFIQVGMFVQCVDAPGAVPFGSTVQSINAAGGTVTLSANATNIAASSRFSFSHYQGVYPASNEFRLYVIGNNILFDGWDLSVGNGWSFHVMAGSSNCTVQNINISIGSNQVPGDGTGNANYDEGTSTTIQYCEMLGNGLTQNIRNILGCYGDGTTIVQYNYIYQGSGQNIVDGDGHANGSDHYFQYNVISDAGMGQQSFGTHGDHIQTYPGSIQNSRHVIFNLLIQTQNVAITGAASQCVTTNGIQAGHLLNDYMDNNVCIIMPNANMNGFFSSGPPGAVYSEVKTNYGAVNNHTGWDFLNPGGGTQPGVVTGNVRMDNGTVMDGTSHT